MLTTGQYGGEPERGELMQHAGVLPACIDSGC